MFDGIEFKDNNSKSLSIVAKSLGRRKRAQEQVYVNEVLDSDRDYDEHTGKFRPYTREMVFHILDMEKKEDIFSWLKGYGKLRTVIDKEGFFYASVISDLSVEDDLGLENFTVQFKINPPFYYLNSGIEKKTYSYTPINLNNPGTHFSEPIIKVVGSGNITLTVNGKSITISNLSGDITLNSELKRAYNATSDQGLKVLGEYPIFTTGSNTISYTGSVTSLEITPNWRDL